VEKVSQEIKGVGSRIEAGPVRTKALQQTAAILISRSFMTHSAAAAAELVVRPLGQTSRQPGVIPSASMSRSFLLSVLGIGLISSSSAACSDRPRSDTTRAHEVPATSDAVRSADSTNPFAFLDSVPESSPNKQPWRSLSRGISQDSVQSILGEPIHVSVQTDGSAVWMYGGMGQVRIAPNGKLLAWEEPFFP
jgi:hypothetical protein